MEPGRLIRIRLLLTNRCAADRTPSFEDLRIGGSFHLDQGPTVPFSVSTASRFTSTHRFDGNSGSRSNSGSDGI